MRYPLFVVIFLAAFATAVRSEDWPEFRGPTGQGHAKGKLPIKWGPKKNVAWKQEIPAGGWSSPVVYQDRVYLTTAVATDGNDRANPPEADISLRAVCLDAKTVKILWNEEAIRQPSDKLTRNWLEYGYASPTPIVDGKRLYVHFGHLGTACLNLEGKVLWTNTDFHHEPKYGNGGTPILVGNLLVFSIDDAGKEFVVALKKTTGKVVWQTDRSETSGPGSGSLSTPLLIEVKGQRQIISTGNGMVGAYDPKTGEEIWRVCCRGNAVVPRPVYGHGMLFVSIGMGSDTVMAIRPDGKGDVTDSHVVWTMNDDHRVPSLLLNGNELYMVSDNGVAKCVDAKTGAVHWEERLGGSFYASPMAANGKIYFQSNQGIGYVVKACTEYELLAKNPMDEKSMASYAAVDGAIFLRTEKHLYRIEKRKL